MDTDEKHDADGRPVPGISKDFGDASAQSAEATGTSPRAARSLFEPAELSSRLLPEDLPYASEVEASLAR